MRRFLGWALLAAIAAAPAAVEAQQAPRAAQGQDKAARVGGHASPVERLVERRAELGLTDDQVTRLQSIQTRLQQQNEPLLEQLRASGAWGQSRQGATRGQRGDAAQRSDRGARGERGQRAARAQRGERQIPEELRPTMQQLRENNRVAMQEVREVLTDEQQAQIRAQMEQRRGEARGNRAPRGTR